jgi:lipid-A-disaccharide synthase
VTTLLVSAGDASGDLHAADFVRTFRERHPGTRFVGLGGAAMQAAGVELVADQRELAVGGLFELLGSLARVARAWRKLAASLACARPDLVVLVDSGGFNLPFAARVRRRSRAPILYYVAPQVWAWRAGRIRKLARRVDRLAVILPFEAKLYRETGLRVDFVGHPLVDPLGEVRRTLGRAAARARCGLAAEGPVVTLLPGSRRNEIDAHLAIQLRTAQLLLEQEPGLRFLLALAPSIRERDVRVRCESALPRDFPLRVLSGAAREAIRAADVVLAKPGSVTLEAALLGRPMVVMGRAHPLTAWILRRAVRVDSLTMPNLIAGEPIVPEFLQQEAMPGRLAAAVVELLGGPRREAQLERLARVCRDLGPGGAVDRVCEIAEEMLAAPCT